MHGVDEKMTERHMQAIWYDATLRPALNTSTGMPVNVLNPGEWNVGPGPDFHNAELVVAGRHLKGDVELHLNATGWKAHGHDRDTAYRHVVAHVVWHAGEVDGLPPGCVTICLGEAMPNTFSPACVDVALYPKSRLPDGERPCSQYCTKNPDLAEAILRRAGKSRILEKSMRMSVRMARLPPEQVFYEEVFAGFGYGGNETVFRDIAARVPLRELPTDAHTAWEALWTAGNGRFVHKGRPANAPEVRLRDAVSLFTGGKPQGLGRGRMGALMANAIVPFVIARGALNHVPDWLPPEDASGPVRLTALRLFGPDHNPAFYLKNGVLLQGLIAIHRTYCLKVHPACAGCILYQTLKRVQEKELNGRTKNIEIGQNVFR